MAQYWLSFVGDGFLGACLVEGDLATPKAAIQHAWRLGINPGGEVLVIPVAVEDEWKGKPHVNKLFTDQQEIEHIFGPVQKIDAGE